MSAKGKLKQQRNKPRTSSELEHFIEEKIIRIKDIVKNTLFAIEKQRNSNIFSNNDRQTAITILLELTSMITQLELQLNKNTTVETLINDLQKIIDKTSIIICGFGTLFLDDILYICFGDEFYNTFITSLDSLKRDKYAIIKQYVVPIGYKIIQWQPTKQPIETNVLTINKITDDINSIESSNSLECYESDMCSNNDFIKICGIRIVINNEKARKTIIINGIAEPAMSDCIKNNYTLTKSNQWKHVIKKYTNNEKQILENILDTFSVKDYLIWGIEDIERKMIAVIAEVNSVKREKMELTVTRFSKLDIISKRHMFINLLLYNKNDETRFITYLIHDLLTTQESSTSKIIIDSIPHKLTLLLKLNIQSSVNFTNEITHKYDIQKISLEQQIHLMKANESTKEKAINKMKEIKGKSDESTTKPRNFIEGLLKIPFGIYCEEPILKQINDANIAFKTITETTKYEFPAIQIKNKNKYTALEITQHLENINKYIYQIILHHISKVCETCSNLQITKTIKFLNALNTTTKSNKMTITNVSRNLHIKNIMNYATAWLNNSNPNLFTLYDKLENKTSQTVTKLANDISGLSNKIAAIHKSTEDIKNVLDEAVYSHSHAKNQIVKIFGQWMNGQQGGYCFGFEGSPGVGKTSLAKNGISNCLIDENGIKRPFLFLALGGSTNGSTLEGHGYTYLNSTWGKIVDMLMEAKCMNPIIYIDELDKVSKTEQGREIISIFTHLVDSTQNSHFQDKFFGGVDIDLSKVLFIFSYNDPDQIDKVLLDRIHRIKFNNLSLQDKIIITTKHLLPELNSKMGFENIIDLPIDTITHIINDYTNEPGVRKLKEILFDIYGEINVRILTNTFCKNTQFPILLSINDIDNVYLTKYDKTNIKKVTNVSEVGIINGLWANNLGNGGIIPIQTTFFPTNTFLELKLTGLQGDVMKESMNVAKSVAWNLTSNEIKKKWIEVFEETRCQGIHIHCPEGSISKDGPSAGAAITCAIYSLLNNKPIRSTIALTGEICLSGKITTIGGLDCKITGGIRAGITKLLYPSSNHKDFDSWKKGNDKVNNIEFIEILTIKDAFDIVFS